MLDISAGELSEVILNVQDMNTQVAFYRDALGLYVKEPQSVTDFRDFYSVEFFTGNCTLKLHIGEHTPDLQENPRIVLRVADAQTSRQRLVGQGIEVSEIYSPSEGIYVCEGRDPEGNIFALEARKDIPFDPVEVTPTPSAAPIYVSVRSRRGRSITLLRDKKWLMLGEVLLVIVLLLVSSLSSIISFVTPLLVVMALLWLSGNNWTKMGLRKPGGRWRTSILAGTIGGALFCLLHLLIIEPIGGTLLHTPITAQLFVHSTENSFLAVSSSLLTIWSAQAFGEEMIFRGYLLNRLADLFGRSVTGWSIAYLIQALAFGFTRLSGGPTAVVSATFFGLMIGLLYFLARQNLWSCIVAHGVTGTIFLLLSFFHLG